MGQPQVEEDYITSGITPQQCRLRDMTYSAPISVNVEYTRGKEIVVRQGKDGVGAVNIGRIPLMLRCDRCAVLTVRRPIPCRAQTLCIASIKSMGANVLKNEDHSSVHACLWYRAWCSRSHLSWRIWVTCMARLGR